MSTVATSPSFVELAAGVELVVAFVEALPVAFVPLVVELAVALVVAFVVAFDVVLTWLWIVLAMGAAQV